MVVGLVVNWSTPEDLWQLMLSAEKHEPDLKWVIFQNHHDTVDSVPTLNRIIDKYGPNLVVQFGDRNYGHGYGINRAAAAAHALWKPDYFFAVNPDCKFIEPITAKLVAFLEEDEARMMVGPKQVDSKWHITAAGIEGTSEAPRHRHWQTRDTANELARDQMLSVVVAGSAMMIRADKFFKYGGMLESGHYFSETWLCYHARAHGEECWYYGVPVMIHEWHRSSPLGSPVSDGRVDEDRKMFRDVCDGHDPPIPHN